jgi:hypothetical protein
MRVIERQPEVFTLPDLLHIQRWMCTNCGLILDYQFEPGEIGWPKFEPPWSAVYDWTDEQGEYHVEEPERSELCPRCNVSFEKTPPVSVIIREVKKLSDFVRPGEGEGQTLEFKEGFSVNNLRKTVAAFSTTLGGRIVLGIDKKYQRVGYRGKEKIDTPKGKEDLQIHLRDQVLSVIEPRLTIRVDFVSDSGKNYAVITVIKGPAPIYYSKGVPYVRDLDQSRPATPDEVQALIEKWRI